MVNTIARGWEVCLNRKCTISKVCNGEMAEWSKAPD